MTLSSLGLHSLWGESLMNQKAEYVKSKHKHPRVLEMLREEEIMWNGEGFSRELMIFALKNKTAASSTGGIFSTSI